MWKNKRGVPNEEKRYRQTLDTMPEGCQIIGFDWRYLYLNEAAERHNRRPKEELLGKRYMDEWPGIEATNVFTFIRRCMETRAPQAVEEEFAFPDGSKRWFDLHICPVPEGVAIFSIDISERKQTEEARQSALVRFSAIVSILYGGLLLVGNDNKVELANQAFCNQFGLHEPPQALVGRTSADIVARIRSAYGLPEEEVHRLGEIIAQGRPVKGEEVSMADGRTLLRDFIPISVEGRPYGRLWHQLDITDRKTVEEALRLSEKRFSLAFANSPAGITLSGLDDDVTLDANNTWLALTGYSREEVVGTSVRALNLWHNPDAAQRFVEDLRQSGSIRESEQTFRKKSGELFVAQISAQVLTMQSAKLVLSTLVDITERKRAKDMLHRVIEEAPVGMVMVNREGQILLVNAMTERLFGYTRSELLGRPIETLVPQGVRAVHKGHRAEYLADAKPLPPGVGRDDLCGLHKDGHSFPVDIGLNPIETADGTMVMASVIDITERKAVEEALRSSEEKFSVAFANSPNGITLTRLEDGVLLDVNDTWLALTGYQRQEVVGRSVRTDIPFWPSGELAEQAAHELKEKGLLRGREQKFCKKTGEQFLAQFSSQVLSVRGEKVVLSTMTDITERRAFEERMEQTQKLESLGVLAGGIAHDFNNILQAILGNAEVAAAKLPPSSPAVGNLEEISRSAQRAGDLTRQMLAYSGRSRYQLEPLDLSDVIREMQEMLRVSVSKKAHVDYTLASGLPSVQGDVSQLRQVVMNLMTNASEALGEAPGTIRLTTGSIDCDEASLETVLGSEYLAPGRYVSLEVEDTGRGMDDATRSRIFDPFFTTKFTGRGLGLAAVMGIVRGHKGAIRVESEPGKGTTFTLLFPTVEGSPSRREHTDASRGEWHGHGTVLVVDDEEDVRTTVHQMLERLGFDVVTASDGAEALRILGARRDEVSCVILGGGEEAFHEMKRMLPDLTIIVSSGYSEQTVAQQWAGKGLAGFIQKPYRMSTLEQKLREVLKT